MAIASIVSLLLLSLHAFTSFAQDADPEIESPSTSPALKVQVSASFPQSEIFGVKLVNGRPTTALLSVTNNEPEPVSVAFIGGSLWTDSLSAYGSHILKNLSTERYNVEIPAGASDSLSYKFTTDLHPQELKLNLVAIVADSKGQPFTVQAFNETVGVVEPDASIFDPQILFLYFFLASCFGGVLYFIYSTWISTLFPQQRRGGKGGERAKKSLGGKKVDPADQVSVVGADGPAVTTGAKAYDESWIPAHHINKPAVQRVKSSGRTKSRKQAE